MSWRVSPCVLYGTQQLSLQPELRHGLQFKHTPVAIPSPTADSPYGCVAIPRLSRRRELTGAAETPEGFVGVDEKPTRGHSGRAVTTFMQGVAMQHAEFVTGLDNSHLAAGRDAEEAAIHPHRRAEIVAADTFLEKHVTSRRGQAGDDAAVAPEP